MQLVLTVVAALLASGSADHKSERVNRFHQLRADPTALEIEAKIPSITELIANQTSMYN
jgi:hypothetical protein